MSINEIKDKITEIFESNLKGKQFKDYKGNANHDGKEGYWVEMQMGVKPNASNTPDLFGFEMKKQTSLKTTFGDWSPSDSIFKGKDASITRSDFFHFFGKPNNEKGGRYSWSGTPVPSCLDEYTRFGQIMTINEAHDIVINYSFAEDKRSNKSQIVPNHFQSGIHQLMIWKESKLRENLTAKFGVNGWFKCYKDKNGIYTGIGFAPAITYEQWIEKVKEGIVFFDSGMYETNNRPYAQWRANNTYWESLITDRR